jgi:hypothetical protein
MWDVGCGVWRWSTCPSPRAMAVPARMPTLWALTSLVWCMVCESVCYVGCGMWCVEMVYLSQSPCDGRARPDAHTLGLDQLGLIARHLLALPRKGRHRTDGGDGLLRHTPRLPTHHTTKQRTAATQHLKTRHPAYQHTTQQNTPLSTSKAHAQVNQISHTSPRSCRLAHPTHLKQELCVSLTSA